MLYQIKLDTPSEKRIWADSNHPKLIQLAYSGGKASECLLHMVLRRELLLSGPFIVTCADPGMEDKRTYIFTEAMEKRCGDAGVPFLRAKRNLYQEILEAKKSGATRFDFPPFYTKNRETGKKGVLIQKCTQAYKIFPMDRLARHWMDANLGISRKTKHLGEKILCKWVGFTSDEWIRIKDHPTPKYVYFDYPLVTLKMTTEDVIKYYLDRNLPAPPRSVCSACFANDAAYFEEMYYSRPENWEQAVAVDEEIRDLRQFMVRDECYVYAGCIPLKELADRGFPRLSKKEEEKCHSGHCWI